MNGTMAMWVAVATLATQISDAVSRRCASFGLRTASMG